MKLTKTVFAVASLLFISMQAFAEPPRLYCPQTLSCPPPQSGKKPSPMDCLVPDQNWKMDKGSTAYVPGDYYLVHVSLNNGGAFCVYKEYVAIGSFVQMIGPHMLPDTNAPYNKWKKDYGVQYCPDMNSNLAHYVETKDCPFLPAN